MMETNIECHIDYLIIKGKEKLAGLWQATELFKDETMLVLTNADICLETPQTIEGIQEMTKADQPWSDMHFNERISGIPLNPGESYKSWPYNTFKAEDDPYMKGKKFSHSYMERFWPKEAIYPMQGIRYEYGDLNDVINQLKENKLTRQAYLPIFFPEDTGAVHKERVPCTLGYLFWVDNGMLHCNYYIRSCDALRHFRNDVYLAMMLMNHVKEQIPCVVGLGRLTMYIANFHVFKNDLYTLRKKEEKIRKNGL